MTVAKIGLGAIVQSSYDLPGRFGLSDENGLVYIAHHENAVQNHLKVKHSLELLLDGDRAFTVRQYNDQIDNRSDSVVAIDVEAFEIEPNSAGSRVNVAKIGRGELFVSDKGVYIAGKNDAAAGAEHFLMQSGLASKLHGIEVITFESWILRGYCGGRLVLEVKR